MIRHLIGWIADADISKQYSIIVEPMHQVLEVVICSLGTRDQVQITLAMLLFLIKFC